MGTIKDLVDLVTQLANSVNDRKVATELNAIQSLVAQLQSEQASFHEANIGLREERLALKQRIQDLEDENKGLKTAAITGPSDVPICPNCSTVTKPYYMNKMPKDFAIVMGMSYECPKCQYTQ